MTPHSFTKRGEACGQRYTFAEDKMGERANVGVFTDDVMNVSQSSSRVLIAKLTDKKKHVISYK